MSKIVRRLLIFWNFLLPFVETMSSFDLKQNLWQKSWRKTFKDNKVFLNIAMCSVNFLFPSNCHRISATFKVKQESSHTGKTFPDFITNSTSEFLKGQDSRVMKLNHRRWKAVHFGDEEQKNPRNSRQKIARLLKRRSQLKRDIPPPCATLEEDENHHQSSDSDYPKPGLGVTFKEPAMKSTQLFSPFATTLPLTSLFF